MENVKTVTREERQLQDKLGHAIIYIEPKGSVEIRALQSNIGRQAKVLPNVEEHSHTSASRSRVT